MTAYPAIQLLEDTFGSRVTEVINPTPKLRGQDRNGGPDRASPARPEQHLKLGFESLNRLAGHSKTHVIFPWAYGITQKGSLPGVVYRTLSLIDPQL